MLFLAICRDKSGASGIRAINREAHLAWLKGLGGQVKLAGPFLDDSATEMRGSMLVVEADSLDAAKALLAPDPYAAAGLFEAVEIRPWRWVVGAPAA